MTGDRGLLVLSVDQPYASLIIAGIKQWETRPSPPNGDMRPEGVRGLPGAAMNRGDRLLIASTTRKARSDVKHDGSTVLRADCAPDGWSNYLTGGDDWLPLPLGCILGAVTVTDVYPIIDWPYPGDDYLAIYDRHVRVVRPPGSDRDWVRLSRRNAEGLREGSYHDEVALGDWSPGRWAWALADPTPTTERCPDPRCSPLGGYEVEGRPGLYDWDLTCPVCDGAGSCGPVPVVGRQGVWRWDGTVHPDSFHGGAAGSRTEPLRCPTCGSTQPAARHTGRWWRDDAGVVIEHRHGPCPDSFHGGAAQ